MTKVILIKDKMDKPVLNGGSHFSPKHKKTNNEMILLQHRKLLGISEVKAQNKNRVNLNNRSTRFFYRKYRK